jgi:hypothetical protein
VSRERHDIRDILIHIRADIVTFSVPFQLVPYMYLVRDALRHYDDEDIRQSPLMQVLDEIDTE